MNVQILAFTNLVNMSEKSSPHSEVFCGIPQENLINGGQLYRCSGIDIAHLIIEQVPNRETA